VPAGWWSGGANGAGTHMRQVMAGLRALGARVTTLELPHSSDGRPGRAETLVNLLVQLCPPPLRRCVRDAAFAFGSYLLARQGQRFIDRARPDVIYERSAYFSMTGWLLSRRYGIPRVLEVNGLPRELRQFGIHPAWLPLGDAFERANLRDADRIVTVSATLRRDIERYGADGHRIRVIPCAARADWRETPGESDALRRRLGLTDALVCGFVGHVLPWHGIEVLIRAVASLPQTMDVRALIVGECTMRPRLEALARELGVADGIVFAGEVAHEQLPVYLGAMDVGVIPRHGSVNSPIKLFEYGVAGKAIVAAKTPGIMAVWTPGVHGIGIRNGNAEDLQHAILQYAADADLRRRHGQAFRRKVLAEHTWEHVCRRTLDVLHEAIGACSRGRHATFAPRRRDA